MDRRDFIRTGFLATAGAALAGSVATRVAAAAVPDRPNVLYIIVHDLGDALACYGVHGVRSPRLDRFGAEGVRFAHYHCCSTPCSPSRGCIVTGRYAHTTGLIGLSNRGWDLPRTEKTMVDYFNEAGYHTVNFGGYHERIGPGAYAYAEKAKPARLKADQIADDVCAFLKAWDPARGPFFINAYSQDVHAPYDRPEFQGKFDPDQVRPPAFLPNIPAIRKSLAQFYGSVEVMDAAMGRIFDTLEATGLAARTIVIFTTDHGVGFPRAKSTLYDPGLSTALLIRWPGRVKPPGMVCDHLLGNVDLLPTMLELTGQPAGPAIQGRSFAPAILGGDYKPNEQIFAERNYHDDYDPIRGVRTTRYKYIRNYAARNRYKMPDEATEQDDPGTLRNSGQARPFEELYDLEKDPLEFKNVAEDPANAEVLKDLRGRLDKWMAETGDYMRGAKETVMWPASDTRTGGPPIPNARTPQKGKANAKAKSKKKK